MLRWLVVAFALCLAVTAGPTTEAEPARPALRFYGTGGLHAYLLSTDAGPYYGLLLHQLAIIDESDTPFEVSGVEFALLDNESVPASPGRLLPNGEQDQPSPCRCLRARCATTH
jgi:hypothetical protein